MYRNHWPIGIITKLKPLAANNFANKLFAVIMISGRQFLTLEESDIILALNHRKNVNVHNNTMMSMSLKTSNIDILMKIVSTEIYIYPTKIGIKFTEPAKSI